MITRVLFYCSFCIYDAVFFSISNYSLQNSKNLDQKSVTWVQTKIEQFNLHEAKIDCSVVVMDYISFIQVYTINCRLSVDMIKYPSCKVLLVFFKFKNLKTLSS